MYGRRVDYGTTVGISHRQKKDTHERDGKKIKPALIAYAETRGLGHLRLISDRRCTVRSQDERGKCAVKLALAAGSCQHARLIAAGRKVSGERCRNGLSARVSTIWLANLVSENNRRSVTCEEMTIKYNAL
jgi:hypothetical protein